MTDDELRALATAAGAKEWRAGTSERWHVFEWTVDDVLGSHERVIARTNDNLDGFERLTNFIAAANPARVLSLLDRAQRAEAELAALRRVGREGDGAMNAIEILTADRDDWKRRAGRAEAERDRAEERVTEGEQLRLSAEIAEQHAKDDLRRAEAERERDAAIRERDDLRAKAQCVSDLFGKYFEYNSAEHEDEDCPQDDTCECPLVHCINEAFDVLRDIAKGPQ